MITLRLRHFFALLLLVAIASCQQAPNDSARTDEATIESTTPSDAVDESSSAGQSKIKEPQAKDPEQKSSPKPVAVALQPGTYCYQTRTEIEDIDTRFTVGSDDRITGKLQGVVHNEAEGYYTSYAQKLDGTINGSNLDLDVATWIEYDQQNRQETWKVSANQLDINDRTVLSKADCAEVSKVFQNEAGLEAEDLTADAKNVSTQQVSFDAGKSSATVEGSVTGGDRNVYTLTAQGGQQMDLSITSLEDNAVFDVVAPSGLILGTEMKQEQVSLPHTGEYEVIVGGTRGNATYDLAIAIE